MTDMNFPTIISNTEQADDLAALQNWVTTNIDSLTADLDRTGAILFRGFPISSAEDFDAFSLAFGFEHFTYQESLSNAVRINLTPRVFTANEAPPTVEIFLHHVRFEFPSRG